MTESDDIDDDDAAIIAALQESPRAAWPLVASRTGLAPVTVARRWRRIQASGLAWVTTAPGHTLWSDGCVAFVEVVADAGQAARLAGTLAADPRCLTVELTAGATDILLTVATPDTASLAAYVIDELGRTPGVRRTTTHLGTALYQGGAAWRLPRTARVVRADAAERTAVGSAVGSRTPSRVDRAVLDALTADGRAAFTDLGTAAGIPPARARARMQSLLHTGTMVLRTDVAAAAWGWPIAAVMFIRAPARLLAEAARAAARHPQTRLSTTVADTPSLVVVVWLRHARELHDVERALRRDMPHALVERSLIVLRTVKRMGRVLDTDGRAVSTVPLGAWGAAASGGPACGAGGT